MNRGILTILAIMLAAVLLSGNAVVHAQNADDPPPKQDDPPAEDPPAEDPESGDAQEQPTEDDAQLRIIDEEDEEEARRINPRLRPSTDEEERAFKRQATRNDPFLNPLLPLDHERIDNSGYNPRDAIRPEGFQDLARYIVQTPGGEVEGFLTIHSSIEELALLGRVMNVSKLCEYGEHRRIDLQVQLQTIRPTFMQSVPTEQNRSQQAQELGLEEALRAEYLFDRITIREHIGGISGVERERMLPFSFDINQLDSIVRAIDYESPELPLVAVLFDAAERENVPVSIDVPRRSSMKSAELEDYGCWEVTMHVGNETWTWWVERLEPHRIIRWTTPQRSFTLMSYTQGQ